MPEAVKRCTKIKYRDEDTATRFGNSISKKEGGHGKLSPYFCHSCKAWHLTSGDSKEERIVRQNTLIRILVAEKRQVLYRNIELEKILRKFQSGDEIITVSAFDKFLNSIDKYLPYSNIEEIKTIDWPKKYKVNLKYNITRKKIKL